MENVTQNDKFRAIGRIHSSAFARVTIYVRARGPNCPKTRPPPLPVGKGVEAWFPRGESDSRCWIVGMIGTEIGKSIESFEIVPSNF